MAKCCTGKCGTKKASTTKTTKKPAAKKDAAPPAKADAKAWVSTKTGLPIQVESSGSFMGHASTTRVRYSRFDDASIRVDAPN